MKVIKEVEGLKLWVKGENGWKEIMEIDGVLEYEDMGYDVSLNKRLGIGGGNRRIKRRRKNRLKEKG